jgi:DHA2 family multidrug resistance protein
MSNSAHNKGRMENEAGWMPAFNPWLIAATMILPTFMVALDTSVANVALPHIAGSLSASAEEATWTLTSYLVANAIILPATAWLSGLFGRKKFLLMSIVAFTVSSGFSGAALTLDMLIFFRVVQGASGGVLLPISQAILLESFPPEDRGQAMAAFALGVIVAPIVGPTLGGWITDNYSWRWIFYINLPVGILALLMTQMFIEDPPYIKRVSRKEIDYTGFALMAVGLGTLQVILDKGQQDDWFAASWIRWFALISAVSIIAFVVKELKTKKPIVDLRIIKDRNFAVGILIATAYGAIVYGTLLILPLFLEDLMNYSAFESGLTISPRGIGAMVSVAVAGWMIKKVDGRVMMVGGFLLIAWAGFLFGKINLEIAPIDVVLPNIILGSAIGFVFVPLTTIAMGMLPNEKMGTGTGIYNLMRNIGGSIGIAVITTILARSSQAYQATLVSHLTPYDQPFQQSFDRLHGFFLAQNDPVTATRMALGTIYQSLLDQSMLLAYMINFQLLGILALICIPFVFLFRGVEKKEGSQNIAGD